MRPLAIRIKNFMNHSESFIDFSKHQLFSILGKTLKNDLISNGVGKTTILRAIEYVIFNQSYATTLDKIVRDGKKKASVEFDFEINKEIYRIYRHRTSAGTSDVRLYQKQGEEFVSISERTPSSTDDKIKDLIKISHKGFTNSVLFRQVDLTGLTAIEDPKKRKELLKEPLNLVQYTKLEEIASKKARPIKKDIENIELTISNIGDTDKDIEKANIDLDQCKKDIDSKQNEIISAEHVIVEKKKIIEELKLSISSDDVEIHKKIAEQERKISEINSNIKNINKKTSSVNSKLLEAESSYKSILQKIDKIKIDISALNEVETRDLKVVSEELKKLSSDEVKGSELISELKTEIRLLRKTIPSEDSCPACQQPITKEYRSKIENDIQESVKLKADKLTLNEEVMVKLRSKKSKLELEKRKIEEKISSISSNETKLSSLLKEQNTLNDSIINLKEQQESYEKEFLLFDSKSKEALLSFESLKDIASKSNVADINNKIFAINEELSVYKNSIESFRSRISNLNMLQGGLLEKIKTRSEDKEKLVILRQALKDKRSELKLHQMVIDSFKAIPSFIMLDILDNLEIEVNSVLNYIRPDLQVKVDSECNIEYTREGKQRDYSQLSYGQQVYLALAFKMGLSKIIQKRLGVDLRLLVMDECCSNLDAQGILDYWELINKWSKEFTVLVITHNNYLKDKFSHSILVEETDDGSQAKVI